MHDWLVFEGLCREDGPFQEHAFGKGQSLLGSLAYLSESNLAIIFLPFSSLGAS